MSEIKTLKLKSSDCEQIIKISVEPDVKYQKWVGRSFFSTPPFIKNIVITLDVEGDSAIQKHSVKMTLQKFQGSQRIMKDSTYQISGGMPLSIPIDSYSSYIMKFKTNEWGEECKKPEGSVQYTLINQEEKISNGHDGNGGGNDNEEVSPLITPLKLTAAMLAGGGVFLATYSIFK
tara:strand:+ start:5929 stop:6456 length:528 start_codon:yes stop_codon:yes gene_type:complete